MIRKPIDVGSETAMAYLGHLPVHEGTDVRWEEIRGWQCHTVEQDRYHRDSPLDRRPDFTADPVLLSLDQPLSFINFRQPVWTDEHNKNTHGLQRRANLVGIHRSRTHGLVVQEDRRSVEVVGQQFEGGCRAEARIGTPVVDEDVDHE
nr:hypothetical protein [Kibdelosporangium aridum]